MLLLFVILLALGYCCFIIFMFSLIRAGRRADDAEEKILDKMLGHNRN